MSAPAPPSETVAAADPSRPARLRRLLLPAVIVLIAAIPLSLGFRRLAVVPAFAVRHVSVKGAKHFPEDEARRLAGIEPGQPWLLVDRRAAELRLESHPWIEHARVLRPWPGFVRLSISECAPVARVEIAGRTYGLCQDLRVVPSGDEILPRIRGRGREKTDPDALARGLDYVAALRRAGIAGKEPVELEVNQGDGDRIVLPERGFTATVDEQIPVRLAVRNVRAFLETLDEEGGSRGTLRLVSGDTAVWRGTSTRSQAAG